MKIETVATKLHKKYGYIMTVLMIISIIISALRLWQECKKNNHKVDGPKSIGPFRRKILNRVVDKVRPGLSKEDKKAFIDDLIMEIQNTSEEDLNVICSTTY